MFTDLIAAIEECRFRALTERTGDKTKRYGNRIMYSVGCDRYHTVLPEVR